jgi:DNA ligase-associated metallophosphoesterase
VLKKANIKSIIFAKQQFTLDAGGILYWPQQETLIVSDLHLEKGSYFAARNQLIPIYDTAHTLERLAQLVLQYQPRRVICLGDNFHDGKALARMQEDDLSQLNNLCSQVSEWVWVIGNHEQKHGLSFLTEHMQFAADYALENIYLTHEFAENLPFQIGGHFHPKISIKVKQNSISGKCFVVSRNKIILPAFGSYTGGMNVNASIIAETLQQRSFKCFLIRENAIWRVR